MSYQKEIGSFLSTLIVEMVTEDEHGGDFTKLPDYQKANQVWKKKAAHAYQDSFDKHEHEGIEAAHKHAMAAVHSTFERMKKAAKANTGRRERDSAMRDMGMTKVRGSQSGRTYWESAELSAQDWEALMESAEDHPSFKAGMRSYNNTFRKTAKTKGQQERMNNHHFSTAKEKHIAGIGNLPDKVVAAKHFTAGYEAAHAKHRADSANEAEIRENWQAHSGRPAPGGETESPAHKSLTGTHGLKHDAHWTDSGFDYDSRKGHDIHVNSYRHPDNHYGHELRTHHWTSPSTGKQEFHWSRHVGAGVVKATGKGQKSLETHLKKHPLPGK